MALVRAADRPIFIPVVWPTARLLVRAADPTGFAQNAAEFFIALYTHRNPAARDCSVDKLS